MVILLYIYYIIFIVLLLTDMVTSLTSGRVVTLEMDALPDVLCGAVGEVCIGWK